MPNDEPWGLPMPITGKICVYLAALISVYSAMQYSIGLMKKLKDERKKRRELKEQSAPQEKPSKEETKVKEKEEKEDSELASNKDSPK